MVMANAATRAPSLVLTHIAIGGECGSATVDDVSVSMPGSCGKLTALVLQRRVVW